MIHSLLCIEWGGCAGSGYTDDDPPSLGRGARERSCYGGNLAHHGRIQGVKRRGKKLCVKEGEFGNNVTYCFKFSTNIINHSIYTWLPTF